MPRILIVTGNFPDHSETFILNQVAGFAKRGWEVMVSAETINMQDYESWSAHSGVRVRLHASQPFVEEYINKPVAAIWHLIRHFGFGIRQKLADIVGLNLKLRSAALFDAIQDFQPHLVYANWGNHGMMAAPAARQFEVPLCVHFRGHDFTVYPQRYGWDSYIRTLEGATLIVHSGFAESVLKQNMPRFKLRRIRYGGIERSTFCPPERCNRWSKPLNLLMVGRMVRVKGPLVAVQTLALLRARHPELNAHLVLTGGSGNAMSAVKNYIRALGLQETVEMLGWASQAQVAECMSKADILLVPSQRGALGWQEAFCNVVVEGLACGLPVIGSKSGGLPETIGNGGYVVRAGSAKEFADAIVTILNEGTPKQWRERALQSAERFSQENMINDYVTVARAAAGL